MTGFCLANRHDLFARMIDPGAAYSQPGTPTALVASQHADQYSKRIGLLTSPGRRFASAKFLPL
jgi:hypothetical protein